MMGLVSKPQLVTVDHCAQLGRIYKDMFSDSKFENIESLSNARLWYEKAMHLETQPTEHVGLNVALLMVASGEPPTDSKMMSCPPATQSIINHLKLVLKKKGPISEMNNYWDAAFAFFIGALTGVRAGPLPGFLLHLYPPLS
jgi:hypothetical protein